ncbi:MAG TPA: lysylphosphatidylglycerol synthase transmembrane domain-containing protein [Tetrasphaera sp.]|nr:lysylphosphatidylglycerol synthase transmembrane domain-containing protein [Tetrasphaera sp.]
MWWRWARVVGGASILAFLLARLGGDSFVVALRATDARALVAGTVIGAVTTLCAAWRWRVVARALRIELPLGSAVAACYRAQFLNVTLPGGVLGDLDRGVHNGREIDDLGRGLRAVVWERTAGQVVLATLTVGALLIWQPFGSPSVLIAAGSLVGAAILLSAMAYAVRSRRTPAGRFARLAAEARGLTAPATLLAMAATSLVVIAGHLATFLLAARTVGVQLPVADLIPLALVVLGAAGLPVNVAGWGPREGAAAWVFGAVGAGAAQGLAVAVAYGVIVVVATLPGALLLLIGRARWNPAVLAAQAGTHG